MTVVGLYLSWLSGGPLGLLAIMAAALVLAWLVYRTTSHDTNFWVKSRSAYWRSQMGGSEFMQDWYISFGGLMYKNTVSRDNIMSVRRADGIATDNGMLCAEQLVEKYAFQMFRLDDFGKIYDVQPYKGEKNGSIGCNKDD